LKTETKKQRSVMVIVQLPFSCVAEVYAKMSGVQSNLIQNLKL